MRTLITALLALLYLGDVLTPAILVGASFKLGGILPGVMQRSGRSPAGSADCSDTATLRPAARSRAMAASAVPAGMPHTGMSGAFFWRRRVELGWESPTRGEITSPGRGRASAFFRSPCCPAWRSGPRRLTLGAMCGRFALSMTPTDLAGVYGTRNPVPNFQPNWNLPPSQLAPVVRHDPKTGKRSLDVLRWGLIPHFERDPAHARMLNNARAETVAKLPSFRGAFAARRCIVPAEAFYEWKRDGKLKQPFAIARVDAALLAFGGVWESWTDPANGAITRSFAIVTTDANGTMAPIHDRMPVVLEPADWPVWLGEEEGDPKTLLRSAADTVLKTWPVSTDVNSVRHNGVELLRPMREESVVGGPNPA